MVRSARTHRVEAEDAGERLDKVLVRRFPGLGRRGAASLVERGRVLVDGRRAAKSRRVALGESITVEIDAEGSPPAEPEAPLVIRLERPDLVIADKPAGQATAPLLATERGTLAGALLGRYPEMAAIGYRPREPGILHRLDTRTSGLVLAARSAPVFETLRAALLTERLEKRYLAVIEGDEIIEAGVIERALMPHPSGSGRVLVAPPGESAPGARLCRSSFRVLERRGRRALCEVRACRAYRHQVRVHLASSGWPIVGDADYGGAPSDHLIDRHALHASHVAWAGDDRVPAFAVDSPLPDALAACLREGADDGAAPPRIVASSS